MFLYKVFRLYKSQTIASTLAIRLNATKEITYQF